MNSRYNYRDDDTFKNNLETVYKNLIDKNIIYSTQYIHDEDINCDGDEFKSYWEIVFLCIEKTENDYIFHIFIVIKYFLMLKHILKQLINFINLLKN